MRGRHKKLNPKDCDIRVRVTKTEHTKINELCGKTGMSIADVIRCGIDMVAKASCNTYIFTEEEEDT